MKRFTQKNVINFASQRFDLVVFDSEGKRLLTYSGANAFNVIEEMTRLRYVNAIFKICDLDGTKNMEKKNNIKDYLEYEVKNLYFKNNGGE